MEASYYSAALVKFPPVCYYCGKDEGGLVTEGVAELKRSYGVNNLTNIHQVVLYPVRQKNTPTILFPTRNPS